jgi:biotin transport system permease protein
MLNAYISNKTWLHKWPASFKLALVALLSIYSLATNSLVQLGLVLMGVSLAYLSLGAPGRRRLTENLRLLLPICALIATAHLAIVIVVNDFSQLATAARVIIQILALVLAANLITVTTSLEELMTVIEKILRCVGLAKAKRRRLALGIGLVFRLVYLMRRSFGEIQMAFLARGLRRRGLSNIPILFRRSLVHSKTVSIALSSRLRALDRP